MATRLKQKTASIAQNRDRRPTAHARHLRISPYKVRTVLGVVRGKPVIEALALLQNMPRGASEAVYKVINSAVANAENNLNMIRDDLFVAEITASQGPTLKRMLPRGKGSSNRILKRTSHITVKLDEVGDEVVVRATDVKDDKSSVAKKSQASKTKTSAKATKPKAVKRDSKAVGGKTQTKPVAKKQEEKKDKPKATDTKPKKQSSVAKETDNGSKG